MASFCYLIITALALLATNAQDCTSNFIGSAEADFNGDFGVDGSVTIASNGSFYIDVTIEQSLDTSICTNNPYPLQYHIHELWTHDDQKDKYGDQCGPDYTGGHYNPYGRPPCTDVSNPTFYNCEIGDLSGRFGEVTPGLLGHVRVTETLNDGDCACGRLTPEMGYTRSIVFHCNDGTRLFCAPFRVLFHGIKDEYKHT